MEIKRLKILGIEIFKTGNKLNPTYIKNIFHRPINTKSVLQ